MSNGARDREHQYFLGAGIQQHAGAGRNRRAGCEYVIDEQDVFTGDRSRMHDSKRIFDTFAARLRIHAGAMTSGVLGASQSVLGKGQSSKFGQCVREHRCLIEAPLFFSFRMERHGYDASRAIERRALADLMH